MAEEDETTFISFEGMRAPGRDEDAVLSRAAFELHAFGILHAVRALHPEFVSDEYLNSIAAETTHVAAELEVAGLWRRTDGGYEVLDKVSVQQFIDIQARMIEMGEEE